MPKEWRSIKEIETCPECGAWIAQIRNDSNIEAWAVCSECEVQTSLEFDEPYIAEKHKHYRMEAGL